LGTSLLDEEPEERERVAGVVRPAAAEEGRIGYQRAPPLARQGASEQVGDVGGHAEEDLEEDVVVGDIGGRHLPPYGDRWIGVWLGDPIE
jgi:hypothetical protein